MTREAALIAASVLLAATLVVPRLIARWSLWGARIVARDGAHRSDDPRATDPRITDRTPLRGRGWRDEDSGSRSSRSAGGSSRRRGAIGLTRLFVVFETRPRETRIISDLLAGVIYLVTLLAIVNFVFEVPIGGLLATSGVIAIVLGLALQSSLADVFSGIAVGIERPL